MKGENTAGSLGDRNSSSDRVVGSAGGNSGGKKNGEGLMATTGATALVLNEKNET